MSAMDAVAGYPPHAVTKYCLWTNVHGAKFVDWRGACGATGSTSPKSSSGRTFGVSGSALRKELCPKCYPARNHSTHHPDPVEVPTREEV